MVNTVDDTRTTPRIETAPVLTVNDLSVYYHTSRGPVKAVDSVSFDIRAHERHGLVGESGSGKSTIALALLRMIKPPGRIEAGQVILDGTDLLRLNDEQMRSMRLNKIALVAQGGANVVPFSALEREDGSSPLDAAPTVTPWITLEPMPTQARSPTVTLPASVVPGHRCTPSPITQSWSTLACVLTIAASPMRARGCTASRSNGWASRRGMRGDPDQSMTQARGIG